MDGSEEKPLYLRKMTSPQIADAVKQAKIAILVVGSIEQHGPHLPVDTDLATVEYLAEKGLQNARQQSGKLIALIAPAIPFGTTLEMEWPGHLFLQPATLISVICDIGERLVKSGFRYVFILNGCVGSIAAVMVAVQQLKSSHPEGEFLTVGSTWAMPEAIVRDSGPGGMGHACELETSTELAIDPEHVYMEKAINEHMRHPSPLVSYDFDAVSPYYWPVQFAKMTQSGVIGDPRYATAEKGQTILERNIRRIADLLRQIDSLS